MIVVYLNIGDEIKHAQSACIPDLGLWEELSTIRMYANMEFKTLKINTIISLNS